MYSENSGYQNVLCQSYKKFKSNIPQIEKPASIPECSPLRRSFLNHLEGGDSCPSHKRPLIAQQEFEVSFIEEEVHLELQNLPPSVSNLKIT